MSLRKLSIAALLLGLGLVLHGLTPPILLGMRPDFLLAMMFMVIMAGTNVMETLAVGIFSGILTAVTTTFPGGQIGNMIDKPVTAFFVLALCTLLKKVHPVPKSLVVGFLGTFVSGAVFLASASLVAQLPGSLGALLLAVVLPAAVVNTITVSVLYPIMKRVLESGGAKQREPIEPPPEPIHK